MQAAATGRRLIWPAVALLATVILHDLDHVRQGRSVEPLVGAIGVVGDIAAITAVALAIRINRWAAHAAVLVGFATFFGFIAVHVLPDWGPLSDGYPGIGVDGLSWVAAVIPMAAALWLVVSGLSGLRPSRSLSSR